MIGLSRTTGYAIMTLRCLAGGRCQTRSLEDISRCVEVPRSYLPKIVNKLARHGILETKRGVGGGVALTRPASEVTLLHVVEAIEGPGWMTECLLNLGDGPCGDACPTREFWARTRQSITTQLRAITLCDVLAAKTRKSRKPLSDCSCAT